MKIQREHIGTPNKLRVISTNGTHGAHQRFSVEPGETYTFEIDLHRPAGMNKEINVVIWKNTGPSGAYTLHVLNTDGSNTFNYTATSSNIYIQIRQAGTYYLDNIRMYRTYEDTIFVSGYEVDMAYRYGYNTQERVPEIQKDHYTAPYWEYDPRVVHRWNLDPKPVPSISPYAINQGNPIWYSDPLGDTIRNRHIADYQGKGLEYSYSVGGESQQIGDYSVTPYYDSDDNLVGYGAGRQNGKGIGVEYYLDAGDLEDFKKNIDNYTLAADFFYMNGVPSDGIIAMLAGDTWKGLKMQWGEALSDPSYYFSVAMMYAGMRGVKGSPVPKRGKWTYTKGNYKYEVRAHLADPSAPVGTNSAKGPIYRVSRQSTIRSSSGQGTGREYMDIHGNWHKESTLRPTFRDGSPNPDYNPNAANETHIPNKF